MKEGLRRILGTRSAQTLLVVSLSVAAVYALVYRDVVSRAREAYETAERYMAWQADPEAKAAHFENQFDDRRERLRERRRKNEISENEFLALMDAAAFDRDFRVRESSLKYAYQWYKDAYELFSPPESKWAGLARAKAPRVREQWKQELQAAGVPVDDVMFE